MKKLLQATLALSLMFTPTQAFASNANVSTSEYNDAQREENANVPTLEYNDAQREEIAHSLRGRGKKEEEIADFFKALSVVQTTLSSHLLKATSVSNPEPTPVSDLVPQVPVVSTPVPEPTVEEAVQKVTVTMLSLKDEKSKYHKNFITVYCDLHRKMIKSGSTKEEFALHIWIDKDRENRLYYPEKWSDFKKSPLGHRVPDISMVSETLQLPYLHALYYKAMDERYNVQIEDLKRIGSRDTRTEAEIIQSMSIPVELNETQKTIHGVSKTWRETKKLFK